MAAGGAVGAQLGRLLWLHPKPWANGTEHLGLLLSSGPGARTQPGTQACAGLTAQAQPSGVFKLSKGNHVGGDRGLEFVFPKNSGLRAVQSALRKRISS